MSDHRNPILAGLPNYSTLPDTVLTSGPTAEGLGVENLRSDEPAEHIRLTGQRSDLQWIGMEFKDSYFLGCMSLVGHNLAEGDYFRVRVSENPIDGYVRLVPSAELNAINCAGDPADLVDSPDNPDGVFYSVLDVTQRTVLRLEFDVTPLQGAPMQVGDGLQEVRLQLARTGHEQEEKVEATVRLYDDGQEVAEVGRLVLTQDPAPVVASLFFDAKDLEDPRGGRMAIEVECSSAGDKETATLGAIELRAATVASEHDTGMIPIPFSGADPFFNGSLPDPRARVQRYAVYAPREAPTGKFVRIDFQRRVSTGPIDIGVLVVSPAWESPVGMVRGNPFLWAEDTSTQAETRGHRNFGSNALMRRKALSMRFEEIPYAQALSLFLRLDLHLGKVGSFLAIPLPDEAPEVVGLTSVYGRLVDPARLPLSIPTARLMAKTIEMRETVGRAADG